jgi:hypothetical protein
MTINLNGVEIELPNNAKVDVSSDGKKVKIEMPEGQVTEKIRVVEVGSPGVSERIIERIKVVEVEKPCTRPHYQWQYTYPYATTSGGIVGGSYTIGQTGTTTICNNQPDLSSVTTWTGQGIPTSGNFIGMAQSAVPLQ